jgi:DNA-directed RNA polymerase subunit M/transcription elongation factor TFIIS
MFQFCPDCGNSFDISKTAPNKQNNNVQSGGDDNSSETPDTISSSATPKDRRQSRESGSKLEEIIKGILNSTIKSLPKEIIDSFESSQLEQEPLYKNLSIKNKELVFNTIQNLLPLEKKNITNKTISSYAPEAYFVCKRCGYHEQIKEGTVVINKTSEMGIHEYEDMSIYADMKHSPFLPITREYICPNKKCVSQTDHSKREARFKRKNNSYNLRFICLACGEVWKQ